MVDLDVMRKTRCLVLHAYAYGFQPLGAVAAAGRWAARAPGGVAGGTERRLGGDVGRDDDDGGGGP